MRRYMILLLNDKEPYIEFVRDERDIVPYLDTLGDNIREAFVFSFTNECKAALPWKIFRRYKWSED